MNYWLMKTEPGTFSWADLEKSRTTTWDGVRNFQARNHLKAMKKGDLAFIYHTGEEKSIVGIAKITREAYPDPGDKDWVVVDIGAEQKMKMPVTLAQIKGDGDLKTMTLARAPRLSIQPVTKKEFERIVRLGE